MTVKRDWVDIYWRPDGTPSPPKNSLSVTTVPAITSHNYLSHNHLSSYDLSSYGLGSYGLSSYDLSSCDLSSYGLSSYGLHKTKMPRQTELPS